jgi:4-hydroxybenzoate-CoA ligase/benzoate-CoA ligase
MANAVMAFLDEHVATGEGERRAIRTPCGGVTYAELLTLVGQTGHVLREAGVDVEQRVAILLPDGVAWASVFFGALRVGAVAVPLNTRLSPAACAALLRDSRARLLVVDAALAPPLRPWLQELPHLRAVIESGPAAVSPSLEDRQAAARIDLAPEAVSGDDMAVWLYTSGTTGAPKAAIHLHRDLLECRRYGVDVLGAGAGDRMLATSKLFFAYALGNALLLPLFVGAETLLDARWPDPASVAEHVRAFAPTLFFSVPTLYARLLRADLPADLFRSVRACVSAGERLPAEVYAAWRERFGVEILDGLGATETIFMVLSNRPGACRPGATGTPVPGTEARLCDADGREVPDGSPGVLHVRTPSASPGYWNRLDQSRRTFIGPWLRTGDVMTRDAEGVFRHLGREDDFFKVAGLWVAPAEVEAVLRGHPGVAEAAVVGAEDGSGLVKAFAFVVAADGAGGERLVAELTELAAERLAAHQRPRRITIVDSLPRTATGKLQRFALKMPV